MTEDFCFSAEDLTILTADPHFDAYDVTIIAAR
jgi:hypothetical protein